MIKPDRARAIQSIRDHFAAISGSDLSGWTDDEIERSVLRFAEVIGSAGITVEQAARGIQWLNRPTL